MRLSIITVNLNNRDGLQQTINSVVSQTFTDYEWIVIDGGSTDGSRELIEQYKNLFAYWCSEPDKGIYNAMNKGIARAKGDWLHFLNSGDWLANKDVLNEIFSTSMCGEIIYGDFYQVYGKTARTFSFDSELSFSSLYFESIAHPSSFIKRSLLSERLYNEKYKIVADWEFFLECSLMGINFVHKDIVVSNYDTTGISSKNRELVLKERTTAINDLVPKCIQKDMNDLDKMKHILADGQLLEINTIRNKNRFLHRLVTLNLYILRFFYKLTIRK